MDIESMKCKICSGEIEEDNTTEICYSCQSIMINQNMDFDGFKI